MSRDLGLIGDDESGGAHTSRTIMLHELQVLLAACSSGGDPSSFAEAIVERNVLAKQSESTRMRSLRYLRELYVLDSGSTLFRGLQDLWDADRDAQPLLALLCALARDPLLRATADTVLSTVTGGLVDASMLAAAVAERFPSSYSDSIRNKVGRNAASSWTQSGHLDGRHIWDGRGDGFGVLVNYHRLDRQLLDRITHTLLGSWIELQRDQVRKELPGAEARLVAATELQDKLELIAAGEPPYDIYVRWKPLHEQPIGWDSDLNDGVRLNVRPFVTAGVLRSKFTINWKKDRGKDPDGPERLNDLHYTRAGKQVAREKAGR